MGIYVIYKPIRGLQNGQRFISSIVPANKDSQIVTSMWGRGITNLTYIDTINGSSSYLSYLSYLISLLAFHDFIILERQKCNRSKGIFKRTELYFQESLSTLHCLVRSRLVCPFFRQSTRPSVRVFLP